MASARRHDPVGRRKVAILGGGMAGLSAAWELSAGEWRKRFDSITVYQRGARLGGKAASSRGAFGRIEEHGLHVWMGYYDNAFRLVRECYEELDRERTDSECPITSWRDAFEPAGRLGVADGPGRRGYWIVDFADNDRIPGEASPPPDDAEVLPKLLGAAAAALQSIGSPSRRGLVLSASPDPPPPRAQPWADDAAGLARDLESGAVGAIAATLNRLASMPSAGAVDVLSPNLRALRRFVAERLAGDRAARRAAEVIELLLVIASGVVVDGLVGDIERFRRVDSQSGRSWLLRHGASPTVVDGALMRGFHDLVFGYGAGDPRDPTFPAGLGVQLATRMFFDYKGSLSWRMRAGMGDVVIAPLYQALRRRGVRFRFFHDVAGMHPSPDRSTVDRIDMTIQAELKPGAQFDPLTRVGGLPVFPAEPDHHQLTGRAVHHTHELESTWYDRRGLRRVSLERQKDFDVVVLAIPVGALPACAADLIQRNDAWRAMTDGMSTVATQSFQVWLRKGEADLGWADAGAVVAGGGQPFDTYASMSHVLPMERWPARGRPQALGYFCSVLPDGDRSTLDRASHTAATERVRAAAVEYLAGRAGSHWPALDDGTGLDWESLVAPATLTGPARFGAQFWTANVDPSDRYVQATPGSASLRLAPDRSGFTNLFLAGDWTDCGLNAGCIEAAVLSGVQAAGAINEEPRGHRQIGGWQRLSRPADVA